LEGGTVGLPITIEDLMSAGAHYGHKPSQWNPRMKPFIYGVRNKIHIIHLGATLTQLELAYQKTVEILKQGGKALFVGTKPQAREVIKEEAIRAGQFFVAYRWLGGTITNLSTIRKSVEKFQKIRGGKTIQKPGRDLRYEKTPRFIVCSRCGSGIYCYI